MVRRCTKKGAKLAIGSPCPYGAVIPGKKGPGPFAGPRGQGGPPWS